MIAKRNRIWWYMVAMIALAIIVALPFMLNPKAGYGGSDNAGSDLIMQRSPGYTPWFSSFWHPPPETESMLFALQAAIGAVVIGYFIGYVRGRSASGRSEE